MNARRTGPWDSSTLCANTTAGGRSCGGLGQSLVHGNETVESFNHHAPLPDDYLAGVSQGNGFSGYTTYQQGPSSFSGNTLANNINFNSAPSHHAVTLAQHPVTPRDTLIPISKPHACPCCGTPFRRKGDMERHKKKHGSRDLKCNQAGCGWAFYRKDKLDNHMKVHKG